MNKLESLLIFGLVLTIGCVLTARADPEPEPAKGKHRSVYNAPVNPKFRSVPLPDDVEEHLVAELRQVEDSPAENDEENTPSKGDASSGRLFMKKFLLFKNIFGTNTQQPVIPIIITGAGNTGTTNPTTTITSTGTIPTATGTITTSPVTGRIHPDEEGDEEEAQEAAEAVDVQALQAAIAAGAQEYVVTDQEIKGTLDSKATKQTDSINLRRKGAKRGQVIQVRIPPKYRRYFKNGQKVMLNTNNRNTNRRVVKKRVNRNRRRVNKNNRNRLVPLA